MRLELYQYGLKNALSDIEELLEKALQTNNKNEKNKTVSEAYGMVKAVEALIKDEIYDKETVNEGIAV